MTRDAEGRGPAPSGEAHAEHAELSPAARRALAEAEARRVAARSEGPPEVNGRGGLEPVRYGDWEVKGLACDF